jgi:hypothetical protein
MAGSNVRICNAVGNDVIVFEAGSMTVAKGGCQGTHTDLASPTITNGLNATVDNPLTTPSLMIHHGVRQLPASI